MSDPTYLGELEQLVLLAVLRLDGHGYGATVFKELNERAGRRVSTGALYATLERLEQKGMIQSRLAEPEPGRGGRRKRFMTVTAQGRVALARVRDVWTKMWEGLDVSLGTNEP